MIDVYIISRDIVGYGTNMNQQYDLGVSRNGVYRPWNDHSNMFQKLVKSWGPGHHVALLRSFGSNNNGELNNLFYMHYWTFLGMGNSLGHDRTTSRYGPCISGPRLSCFKWWPMVSSCRKLSQLSCNIWRSPQWCCKGGDICSSFQLSVSKTCGYSSKKLMAGHKAKSQLSYSQLAVLLLPPCHEKVRSHGTSISQKNILMYFSIILSHMFAFALFTSVTW